MKKRCLAVLLAACVTLGTVLCPMEGTVAYAAETGETTETDDTDTVSTESFSTETLSTETLSTEDDTTESDTMENNSTENNSTESDTMENNSTENNSTENNSTENDTTETVDVDETEKVTGEKMEVAEPETGETMEVSEPETEELSEQPETELVLPTGLMPMETKTVSDIAAEDVYEISDDGIEVYADLKSAVVYDSEWDKYSSYYFYNQMDEAQKEYWDALNAVCSKYLTTQADAAYNATYDAYYTDFVTSTELTRSEMDTVYYIFKYSNPQYYFLNNYKWSSGSGALAFGIYSAFGDGSARAAATSAVKKQVDAWQSQINACATDEAKVRLIHDLIVNKVEYNWELYNSGFVDEDSQYSQSAYSVFCTDLTVCAGYAQAFEMMCNGSGIDAVAVTSAGHEWNKVRINDSWYNVDCTWADQSTCIYYKYFERSDYYYDVNDQEQNHVEESFWEGYLPTCSLDSGASDFAPGTLPAITQTTAAPVITQAANAGGCTVTITSATPGAFIYYTLDGTAPSAAFSKSSLYRGSFQAPGGVTVRAIAVRDTYWDSSAVSEQLNSNIYYQITYEGNGATSGSMSAQSVAAGGSASLASNAFQRTGYTFSGWNTRADGSGTAYSDGQVISGITGNLTLYAQWKLTNYTITYHLDGGENGSNPSTYTYTTALITLKDATRTGYDFAGWYSDSAYTMRVTQIASGSIGDKTLYAKWTPHEYKITFNGNGSTSGKMSSMTGRKYGTSYTLTANAFKKKSYTFTGWNTKKDGSGKSYSNREKVKNLTSKDGGSVTLYAQWTKTKYKITYKLNSGKNNSKNPSTYTYTTSTITLKNPTRKGYDFAGWYSDSKYKKKVTKIKKGSTGNKTLYAKWTPHKYKITFNGNGSTSGKMSAMTGKKYGTSYTLTANAFKKKGYTFTGWNTKKDGSGKSYSNKEKIKNLTSKSGGSVTLYAQWKKTKYKITYKLNSGKNNSKNPSTYTYTTKTITLKKPTKAGYRFVGWYTDSKYKNKVTKIKKGSTGKITLYAKWKKV